MEAAGERVKRVGVGHDHTVGDLFSSAVPVVFPLVVFAILSTIGMVVGFILLIVPGLVFMTFWSVGVPAIVIERVVRSRPSGAVGTWSAAMPGQCSI